ncbi:MAG: HD domain-containing protein [Candidatus Marsarchaeota archaeon]|nr:HD domain-containing protein [Candidatus Marsarchaeota archaeon]
MMEANKLKTVKRTGWVMYKVANPEHVGDHSYSTSLLSYIIAKRRGLDATRCMIMALIHDINETVTGDIATREDERKQKVSNSVKASLENAGALKVLGIPDSRTGNELKDLWKELKERKTREAKLVYEIDKLDVILLLTKYHRYIKKDENVDEFIRTAEKRMADRELLYILKRAKVQIKRERKRTHLKKA